MEPCVAPSIRSSVTSIIIVVVATPSCSLRIIIPASSKMVNFEKQAVEDRYNAVETSLPAPNLQTASSEHRQRKPTPKHRWVVAGLVLLSYVWLCSPAGDKAVDGIRRKVHHHSGCSTDAPYLRPENETDFSQAKRGEVVWFDCGDEKRYPSPLKCGRMKAPLD